MKMLEKKFVQKENGFNGYYRIIFLKSKEQEFKNFLYNHTDDKENIFKTISEKVDDIIVIQNLNIERNHQNQGHGSQILKEILNNYKIDYAILSCDVTQNQRFGFVLEKFYECHNFKTVEYYQDFPLMVYPQDLALEVIKNLKD